MGDCNPFLPVIQARLASRYTKRAGRCDFVRVRIHLSNGDWFASPITRQSSGSQTSMVEASGLMLVGEGEAKLEPGEIVHVQLMGQHPGQPTVGYPWA